MSKANLEAIHAIQDLRSMGLTYAQISNRLYNRGYYVHARSIEEWNLGIHAPKPEHLEGLKLIQKIENERWAKAYA